MIELLISDDVMVGRLHCELVMSADNPLPELPNGVQVPGDNTVRGVELHELVAVDTGLDTTNVVRSFIVVVEDS